MCGRFTQTQTATALAEIFQVSAVPSLTPAYNIAPTQSVATIISTPARPERQFKLLRWGLVPRWAKDPAMGARLINARTETVAEKPSFRSAFRHRRCLVIADGFYEWQRQDRHKQPYYFRLHHHQPFAFAGLWEQWHGPTGEVLTTCTVPDHGGQLSCATHPRSDASHPGPTGLRHLAGSSAADATAATGPPAAVSCGCHGDLSR